VVEAAVTRRTEDARSADELAPRSDFLEFFYSKLMSGGCQTEDLVVQERSKICAEPSVGHSLRQAGESIGASYYA
jgi:hypothetical protein